MGRRTGLGYVRNTATAVVPLVSYVYVYTFYCCCMTMYTDTSGVRIGECGGIEYTLRASMHQFDLHSNCKTLQLCVVHFFACGGVIPAAVLLCDFD